MSAFTGDPLTKELVYNHSFSDCKSHGSKEEFDGDESLFPLSDDGSFENSPIPEVAATVPITDNFHLPVLTLRFWIISTLLIVFTACLGQYFYFRYNTIFINVFAIILISYPMGRILANILPNSFIGWHGKEHAFGFYLNPGPFNIKEHTLIAIAASTAIYPAYAVDVLAIQRLFYGDVSDLAMQGLKMGGLGSILLLMTTQCLGFGFSGLFQKWLVNPSHMWWPVNLVISNLLHTFHGPESSSWTLKRMKLFQWACIAILIYQFFPGFIMPVLQSIAFMCLVSGGPKGYLGNPMVWHPSQSPVDPRPLLSQLGSGLNGGGVFSLSLDWQAIGSLSPLYTPLWAQLNFLFSNYAFTWVIVPLLFQTNFWNAQNYPMYSTQAFTNNGSVYDVRRILNTTTLRVDASLYDSYSPLRLSPFWAFTYGCSFATITASLVHIGLYHGKEILVNFQLDTPDVHTKMMRKYKSVPFGWYLILFVCTLGLSIFTVEYWNDYLQLRWWGILLAMGLALLFILPVGMIQAISNKRIGLNVLSELIMGFIDPGAPIANAVFKTYGCMSVYQCLSLISDLKLGHYMKIPPRSLFVAQIYGTILGCIVNFFVLDFLIEFNPDIWRGAHNDTVSDPQWRSTSPKISFTASLVWGAVGSMREFGIGSLYSPLLWFFLVGGLAPVPFYFLYRRYPNFGFQYVHWPILFESVGSTANGSANALLSVTFVSLFFQYFMRLYHRRWYDLYNYTLSCALDIGTLLSAAFVYLFLVLTGLVGYYAWNPVRPDPQVWETPEYCYNLTALS